MLDGATVTGITPFLTIPGDVEGKPYRLVANAGKSFQGSIVLGMGFVLTPEEAQALIEKDGRNRDALFPYLNGEDLNSRWDQSPSRWVINFHDWPLDRTSVPAGYGGPVAADYPDCLSIVEEKVRPERERLKRKVRRERWWQFAERASALYATIAGMEHVLARSRIANQHAVASLPNGWVYNEKTVVFANACFAVLQSTVHELWARRYSSTLRRDMQYTPSDCCETFPFPVGSVHAEPLELRYLSWREAITSRQRIGLTTLYKRLHSPDERLPDIAELRQLHADMDRAVAETYGWTDLDLGHGFHETKQGVRFTISAPARREVLARLLRLNHERYRAEVEQGLHGRSEKAGSKSKPRRGKSRRPPGPGLFDRPDTSSPRMTTDAEALIESAGLTPCGPVTWGSEVPSGEPGIYVVEIEEPLPEAPVDPARIRAWTERRRARSGGRQPTVESLTDQLMRSWWPGETVVYVGCTTRPLRERMSESSYENESQ